MVSETMTDPTVLSIITNELFWVLIAFSGILLLSIIISIHEFGHFLAGKAFGIKTVEFSIGFWKKVYTLKNKWDCDWHIGLLPFDGYVKFAGMDEKDALNYPNHRKNQMFYAQ